MAISFSVVTGSTVAPLCFLNTKKFGLGAERVTRTSRYADPTAPFKLAEDPALRRIEWCDQSVVVFSVNWRSEPNAALIAKLLSHALARLDLTRDT